MTKRLQRFIDDFKSVNIPDFYQLPNSPSEIVRINFKRETPYSIRIFIYYEKGYACPTFDLPPELIRHIRGYIPEIVQIELSLTVPENNYPFTPHNWEVVRAKSNKTITSKYFDIINEHNMYNKDDWSPAISIQADLLCLIEKLYDYMYVPENKYIINIHLNIISLVIYNESIV